MSHSFASCMLKAYVDDAVLPAESKQTLTDFVEYATELLDLFSYSFKDVDVNNQPLRTSTNTLNEECKLSICGYSWWPTDDQAIFFELGFKKVAVSQIKPKENIVLGEKTYEIFSNMFNRKFDDNK